MPNFSTAPSSSPESSRVKHTFTYSPPNRTHSTNTPTKSQAAHLFSASSSPSRTTTGLNNNLISERNLQKQHCAGRNWTIDAGAWRQIFSLTTVLTDRSSFKVQHKRDHQQGALIAVNIEGLKKLYYQTLATLNQPSLHSHTIDSETQESLIALELFLVSKGSADVTCPLHDALQTATANLPRKSRLQSDSTHSTVSRPSTLDLHATNSKSNSQLQAPLYNSQTNILESSDPTFGSTGILDNFNITPSENTGEAHLLPPPLFTSKQNASSPKSPVSPATTALQPNFDDTDAPLRSPVNHAASSRYSPHPIPHSTNEYELEVARSSNLYHQSLSRVTKSWKSSSVLTSKIIQRTKHPFHNKQYPFKLNLHALEKWFGQRATSSIHAVLTTSIPPIAVSTASVHSGKERNAYGINGIKLYLTPEGLDRLYFYLLLYAEQHGVEVTSQHPTVKYAHMRQHFYRGASNSTHELSKKNTNKLASAINQLSLFIESQPYKNLLKAQRDLTTSANNLGFNQATLPYLFQCLHRSEALRQHISFAIPQSRQWVIQDPSGRVLYFKSLEDISKTCVHRAEFMHKKEFFKLSKHAHNLQHNFLPDNLTLNPLSKHGPIRRFGLRASAPIPLWEKQQTQILFLDGADDLTIGLKSSGTIENIETLVRLLMIFPLAMGITNAGLTSVAASNEHTFNTLCQYATTISIIAVISEKLRELSSNGHTISPANLAVLQQGIAKIRAFQNDSSVYTSDPSALNSELLQIRSTLYMASDFSPDAQPFPPLLELQASLEEITEVLRGKMRSLVSSMTSNNITGAAVACMNASIFPFSASAAIELSHPQALSETGALSSDLFTLLLNENIDFVSLSGSIVAAFGQILMTGIGAFRAYHAVQSFREERALRKAILNPTFTNHVTDNTPNLLGDIDQQNRITNAILLDSTNFLRACGRNDIVAAISNGTLSLGQLLMFIATASLAPTEGASSVLYFPGVSLTILGIAGNLFAENLEHKHFGDNFRELPTSIAAVCAALPSVDAQLKLALELSYIGNCRFVISKLSSLMSRYPNHSRHELQDLLTSELSKGYHNTARIISSKINSFQSKYYDLPQERGHSMRSRNIASVDQPTNFIEKIDRVMKEHINALFDQHEAASTNHTNNSFDQELTKQHLTHQLDDLLQAHLQSLKGRTSPPSATSSATQSTHPTLRHTELSASGNIVPPAPDREEDIKLHEDSVASSTITLNSNNTTNSSRTNHDQVIIGKMASLVEGFKKDPDSVQQFRDHKLIKRILRWSSRKNANGEAFAPYIQHVKILKHHRFHFFGLTQLTTSILGKHRSLGRLESRLQQLTSTHLPTKGSNAFYIDWNAVSQDLQSIMTHGEQALSEERRSALYNIFFLLYEDEPTHLFGWTARDNVEGRVNERATSKLARHLSGGASHYLANLASRINDGAPST